MTRRGVLFDLDGTLIDSTYHHALAWARAFEQSGVDVALWRVHRAVGMGGDRLVAAVAGDDVEEQHGDALRAAWREEYDALRAEVHPVAGGAEVVRRLADVGYRVAVASSGDPEFTRDAITQLGLDDVLDVVTSSEDADSSKPDPDLVTTTLEQLHVDAAVLVGDTTYDVESELAADIGCVAVRTGGFGEAELLEAGAQTVLGGVGELLDLAWEDVFGPVG